MWSAMNLVGATQRVPGNASGRLMFAQTPPPSSSGCQSFMEEATHGIIGQKPFGPQELEAELRVVNSEVGNMIKRWVFNKAQVLLQNMVSSQRQMPLVAFSNVAGLLCEEAELAPTGFLVLRQGIRFGQATGASQTPGFARLLLELGECLSSQGRHEQALSTFLAARAAHEQTFYSESSYDVQLAVAGCECSTSMAAEMGFKDNVSETFQKPNSVPPIDVYSGFGASSDHSMLVYNPERFKHNHKAAQHWRTVHFGPNHEPADTGIADILAAFGFAMPSRGDGYSGPPEVRGAPNTRTSDGSRTTLFDDWV
jgi:hypothetical protein